MNGLDTVSETEIFESLEFEPDIACESLSHTAPHNITGHILEQPAAFYWLRGCCGAVTAMCEGSSRMIELAQVGMAPFRYLWCMVCDADYVDPNEWSKLGPVGKL